MCIIECWKFDGYFGMNKRVMFYFVYILFQNETCNFLHGFYIPFTKDGF